VIPTRGEHVAIAGLLCSRVERRSEATVAKHSLPVDRSHLREVDQQHVEQALRLRAGILGAGQREAAAPNLVGIFAGDMGHGVDQFKVGHTDFPPKKRGNGRGKHRDTERPAANATSRKKGNTPGSQRGGREDGGRAAGKSTAARTVSGLRR
jgi:hypothetical protein